VVMIISANKPLIWRACDISVDYSYTEEVISQIEGICNEIKSNNIKIACIVTD
ncbi:41115_t:CDS:1, partial [Gigaspora margarita]